MLKDTKRKILEKLKVGSRNQLIDNHRDPPLITITVGSFAHQDSTPSFCTPILGPAHLSRTTNLSSHVSQRRCLVNQKRSSSTRPSSHCGDPRPC